MSLIDIQLHEVDVREQIRLHIKENGIKQRWLANILHLSPGTISLILKKKRDLTDENLDKINGALKTDFKKNETQAA